MDWTVGAVIIAVKSTDGKLIVAVANGVSPAAKLTVASLSIATNGYVTINGTLEVQGTNVTALILGEAGANKAGLNLGANSNLIINSSALGSTNTSNLGM